MRPSPMFPRQALISVGGLGSRLGGMTSRTPKPMLDIGVPDDLARAGMELCGILRSERL